MGITYRNPVATTNLSFRLAIGSLFANCFNLNECNQMFLIENFDSTIVGTVFFIDSNYAGFAAVTNSLTDGVDDNLTGSMVFDTSFPPFPGGGFGQNESVFGLVPGPDFAGQTIDLITFRFDGVAVSQTFIPDFFTFQLVPATQALVSYTVSVYGPGGTNAVPEPSSWFLVGAGIVALASRLAFRRRN